MNETFSESIKAFIFDVDNTLVDTNSFFDELFDNLKGIFVSIYGEDKGKEVFNEFHSELHGGKYSNTVDYYYISKDFVDSLAKRDNISIQDQEKITSLLLGLYNTTPSVFENTREVLELVYKKGFTLAFWTHSGEDWSVLKVKSILQGTNIPFKDVFVFSVSLSDKKDFTSLDFAIKTLNVHPEEVVVVGDNLVADIFSAVSVGVKDVVWYKNSTPRGVSSEDAMKEIVEKKVVMRVVSDMNQLYELVERC